MITHKNSVIINKIKMGIEVLPNTLDLSQCIRNFKTNKRQRIWNSWIFTAQTYKQNLKKQEVVKTNWCFNHGKLTKS